MSNRTNFPYVTNFKVNDFITDNLQINGSIINNQGNQLALPTIAGTFVVNGQSGSTGPTGPTGPIGPTGATGSAGIQSVTSPVNTKIIYAYISLGAVISYTNNPVELTTATYNVTGMTSLTLLGGTFSATPIVFCTPFTGSLPSNNTSIFYNYNASTTTNLIYYTNVNTVPTNLGMFVMIIGPA
jgi:hypothetical protein